MKKMEILLILLLCLNLGLTIGLYGKTRDLEIALQQDEEEIDIQEEAYIENDEDWLADLFADDYGEITEDIDDICTTTPSSHVYIQTLPLEPWTQDRIQEIAAEWNVPYPLILAVMDTESDFREDIGTEKVLGGKGKNRYYGYCQLSIENCRRIQNDYHVDPHTPLGNIEAGCIMLHELIDKYSNNEWSEEYLYTYVITCYRAGEDATSKMGVLPKYATQEYNLYCYWKEMYEDAWEWGDTL